MVLSVGDELLPALYGEGELPAEADKRWGAGVRGLYAALRKVVGTKPGPYTDDEVLSCTSSSDRVSVVATLLELRHRRALLGAIEEASSQLARGHYDLARVASVSTVLPVAAPPTPLSERAKSGGIHPPSGVRVPYQSIQHATGGIIGMWVLGGETGVGKSTLAFNLALAAAKDGKPVLYYDAENGEDVLLYRLSVAYKDTAKIAKAVEKIYVRPSIKTLDSDLLYVPPPALVVVDSAQKYGYELGGKSYREAINSLIRKLEILKRSGYAVVLVSEISRASYGQVSNAGYAETRELEFSADVAAQVVLQDDEVEFHITKNRHRPRRGFVTLLRRTHEWLFEEVEAGADWEDSGTRHDVG